VANANLGQAVALSGFSDPAQLLNGQLLEFNHWPHITRRSPTHPRRRRPGLMLATVRMLQDRGVFIVFGTYTGGS